MKVWHSENPIIFNLDWLFSSDINYVYGKEGMERRGGKEGTPIFLNYFSIIGNFSEQSSDYIVAMTNARREIVSPDTVAIYHCVSRCVRRAYLCGADQFTGRSFEHRREWIRNRLSFLVQVFAIEIVAYAVMSNHLHSLIRTRPDIIKELSDREIAIRWRRLYPRRRLKGQALEPNEFEINEISSDKKLVKLYRSRLSDISWFNRCLNEPIARWSNKEDQCKGRFWEGRFKCQRVYDLAGVLACATYIDLNPIRAGIAKTPESSDYTSIQERIRAKLRRTRQTIVPLVLIEELTHNAFSLDRYLELVDQTGRSIVSGKGSIPQELAPILERLSISVEHWVQTITDFKRMFKRVVGTKENLINAAAKVKKSWFHGVHAAARAFC